MKIKMVVTGDPEEDQYSAKDVAIVVADAWLMERGLVSVPRRVSALGLREVWCTVEESLIYIWDDRSLRVHIFF